MAYVDYVLMSNCVDKCYNGHYNVMYIAVNCAVYAAYNSAKLAALHRTVGLLRSALKLAY